MSSLIGQNAKQAAAQGQRIAILEAQGMRNITIAQKEVERLKSIISERNERVSELCSDLEDARQSQDELRQKNEDLACERSTWRSEAKRAEADLADLRKLVASRTDEDEEEIDDCSPVPRCRQEAAEWARNTDADGKPLSSSNEKWVYRGPGSGKEKEGPTLVGSILSDQLREETGGGGCYRARH